MSITGPGVSPFMITNGSNKHIPEQFCQPPSKLQLYLGKLIKARLKLYWKGLQRDCFTGSNQPGTFCPATQLAFRMHLKHVLEQTVAHK